MWIGDIDVPQPCLDAAEAGQLVIFVGAGASRAQPSGLPDFAQLVRNIGALVGREPTNDEVQHPDVFLGRLEDNGNDVHQRGTGHDDKPKHARDGVVAGVPAHRRQVAEGCLRRLRAATRQQLAAINLRAAVTGVADLVEGARLLRRPRGGG